VLNGVSNRTDEHVSRAAAVAAGRCRAVVQVPWDSQIGSGGPLGTAAVHAYTALAGVLVSGFVAQVSPEVAAAGSNAVDPSAQPPGASR
jgi:hypothetical protein